MPGDVAKLLNALALIAVDTVLTLAFIDQLWFSDLPCPLCILQRAGLTAAGFGLALTIRLGPKPSHYAATILGAVVGALAEAEWGDFGTAGDMADTPFASPVRNYYHTNAIARASETMARCIEELLPAATEATGTNG